MNIALVGYGKMGKAIEQILTERDHVVSFIINVENPEEINSINPDNTDVVIEFTNPESAYDNIMSCLKSGVAVISGSTGWLDRYDEVKEYVLANDGSFFYGSNYSLGVNIFFKLNKVLAQLMNGREYDASMLEIHHTQKLDAPSGTAITLAEGMIENLSQKGGWINEPTNETDKIGIISEREEKVPGTHDVQYDSEVDTIKISHVAHSRKGFALGAVIAAEWIKDKKGVFSMDDLLNL